jgi:hypothetical protein
MNKSRGIIAFYIFIVSTFETIEAGLFIKLNKLYSSQKIHLHLCHNIKL